MKVDFFSICMVLGSAVFVSARPQSTANSQATEGTACGSPDAPGVWKMQGDCPRGLEDWMTKGGQHSELDCCYSIPCSGTTKTGASFNGYCMSTNSDGNFDPPKGYQVYSGSRCAVWNRQGSPPSQSGNGDVSANPSQTPGRCVAPESRHSDASSGDGEETGYNSVPGLEASNPFPSDAPAETETQGNELGISELNFGDFD